MLLGEQQSGWGSSQTSSWLGIKSEGKKILPEASRGKFRGKFWNSDKSLDQKRKKKKKSRSVVMCKREVQKVEYLN